jgi:hypothetical protein
MRYCISVNGCLNAARQPLTTVLEMHREILQRPPIMFRSMTPAHCLPLYVNLPQRLGVVSEHAVEGAALRALGAMIIPTQVKKLFQPFSHPTLARFATESERKDCP